METLELDGAPAPDGLRPGLPEEGSSSESPPGDWIFASRSRRGSLRPEALGRTRPRIAPGEPPAGGEVEAELARLVRAGESGAAAGPQRPPSASAPPSPPELPPGLAAQLAGLAEADAFEVDRRLRRALERERTHEARLGPLLRRVLEQRLYRRRGYWDRDRHLEERLGLCPRKARALVRIERVLARAPELARAYRAGQLSWVQTQALAPLFELGVGCGQASAWIDRAASITVRRLQDDVRGALASADLDAERFVPRSRGVGALLPRRAR